MSDRSFGAKPDLMLPVLLLLGLLTIAYLYAPPFRLVLKGLMCMWYGILSYVVLDFKVGNAFFRLSEIFINNFRYKQVLMDLMKLKEIEDIYAVLIDEVRVRFFILFSFVFCGVSYMLKRSLSTVKFFYGKHDLREIIEKKYGLRVQFDKSGKKIIEPFDRVYMKVMKLKRKRNFPINLIARFYPSDSKERVFCYMGSYDYKFVPMSMTRTLQEYFIETAKRETDKGSKIDGQD